MSVTTVPPERTAGRRHAIVIGGSMGGLLAARVLSDHVDRVTLVERDRLPDGAESRRGVPQGRHAHGLLARGERILSRLFPGLTPALRDAGATLVDMGADREVQDPEAEGREDHRTVRRHGRPAGEDVMERSVEEVPCPGELFGQVR